MRIVKLVVLLAVAAALAVALGKLGINLGGAGQSRNFAW
jgi:hypothetical protein